MFHLRFGLSDHLKALRDFVFGSRRRVKKVRIFRAWFSQFVIRISTVDLECRAPDALQRSLHICVNLSFAQARDILSGTAMHEAALLAGACSCKSKSCVVTNSDLGPIFLKTLDDTKYGAQSIIDQAPALGLALLARRFIRSTGRWGDVSEPKTLRDVNEKPFQKFESRLRLFRQPQFSIMARSTAFNTYILSVMPHLNQLRQQAVKFILFFFLQCRAHHYSSDGHEVGKKTTTSRQRGEPNQTKQTQNTTQDKQNQTPTNKGFPKSENQGETV